MNKSCKIPITVLAMFAGEDCPLGRAPASPALIAKYRVIPVRLMTQDGARIIIDKVTHVHRQAAAKVGGLGERYTCLATLGDRQREIYVYKDENEWYMESDF